MKFIISFAFKQAYERGYTWIASYLGSINYIRDSLIENHEIKICDKIFTEKKIDELNDELLVQLACGYLIAPQYEQNFSLEEKTKNEIINRNLCAQVITKALSLKGEHIFFKIYKDKLYQPYANQSALYINKLIDQAISSNNVNYIHSLQKLINNADQKSC